MSRPSAGKFHAAVVAVALIALAALPAAAQATTAELTVSPGQLDFPATTVGNPGGQQQVTAKNTGDVPVSINNVFIDGTNPSDFNQNGNCGGQLDPGQGCTINVSFWAGGAGAAGRRACTSSPTSRGATRSSS